MRRTIVTLLGLVPILAGATAPSPEGRWEGIVQIPGRAQRVVVDLEAGSGGAWSGSIILPGLGVKGDAMTAIAVNGNDVTFAAAHALGSPTQKPPSFEAHLEGAGVMTGRMRQAGHEAPFRLVRTGRAQVDAPVRSTPVGQALVGEWVGEFELGGYPRRVSITIANRAQAATAEFLIVGKQRNVLPVELVVQDGAFLRIESPSTQINFEGRLAESGDELRGVVELGSMELPVALRRTNGSTS